MTTKLIKYQEPLFTTMNTCPRVKARVECPNCGYPASEARYMLLVRAGKFQYLRTGVWRDAPPCIQESGRRHKCTRDQDCEVHMGDCSLDD
jgi:hypothetical protein